MSSQEVEWLLLLSAHVQTQILRVLIWQTQEIQKLQQRRTWACDLAALEQEAVETLVILAARARKAKQKGSGRLFGAEPNIFYRDRAKVDDFWDKWSSYVLLNHNAPPIKDHFTRGVLLITYMKGPLVKEWT